jgi:hypothetical protein
MKLNEREKLILAGVFRDRERLATMGWDDGGFTRGQVGTHRLKIKDARDRGLVPMNAYGWLGHAPTPSESVMLSRAYARLDSWGLIERINAGGHTRQLRLTEAGELLGRELVRAEAAR